MIKRMVCIIAGLACLSMPLAVSAQLLEDRANVKILKARAKLLHLNEDRMTDRLNAQDQRLNGLQGRVDCGSVDIGNQVISSGIGQDISVVITGDIINTGNRCVNTKK